MIKYVDNDCVCGWYFVNDDCYFGDGTRETAEFLFQEYFN